jgi:hypothetical protein
VRVAIEIRAAQDHEERERGDADEAQNPFAPASVGEKQRSEAIADRNDSDPRQRRVINSNGGASEIHEEPATWCARAKIFTRRLSPDPSS